MPRVKDFNSNIICLIFSFRGLKEPIIKANELKERSFENNIKGIPSSKIAVYKKQPLGDFKLITAITRENPYILRLTFI